MSKLYLQQAMEKADAKIKDKIDFKTMDLAELQSRYRKIYPMMPEDIINRMVTIWKENFDKGLPMYDLKIKEESRNNSETSEKHKGPVFSDGKISRGSLTPEQKEEDAEAERKKTDFSVNSLPLTPIRETESEREPVEEEKFEEIQFKK